MTVIKRACGGLDADTQYQTAAIGLLGPDVYTVSSAAIDDGLQGFGRVLFRQKADALQVFLALQQMQQRSDGPIRPPTAQRRHQADIDCVLKVVRPV